MKLRIAARLLCLAVPALTCAAQTLVRSVNGPAANAQFGKACIVVPDQNADGFKDLLVGAPGFNQQRGAIYCVSGGYLANAQGAQIVWSLAPTANQGDLFGFAVADVGDVTGDGAHDFLVGQPGYDLTGFNDVGAVRLVSGASHQAVSLISGPGQSFAMGSAIAATGDVDSDSKSEVLLGAPGNDTSASAIFLVKGAKLSTSGGIYSLSADDYSVYINGVRLGASISSGFDVYDLGAFTASNFVVGMPGFDGPAGADVGKVISGYVSSSGVSPLNLSEEYVSTNPGERLGSSVDAADDYDHDGWIDVVAGAPNSHNGTAFDVGAAVVLSGAHLFGSFAVPAFVYSYSFGSPPAPVNHSDPEPDFHFGAAVRACGDLNGDGVGEFLVGAPDYFAQTFTGWSFKGQVQLYSGATGVQLGTIGGGSTDKLGDSFGNVVDDLDGDGFKEFVVAGSLSDAGGTDSGVVKCYRLFPLQPGTYCAGKINSLGCTPAISFSGSPSASSSAPFTINASNFVNQKNGLLFYSHAPTAVAFQGGTKCVMNPTVRTPPQNSGGATSGSSCTGAYSFDFSSWMLNGWDATLGAGSEVYAQYWSRDPQSPSHTSLSNAIRFLINP